MPDLSLGHAPAVLPFPTEGGIRKEIPLNSPVYFLFSLPQKKRAALATTGDYLREIVANEPYRSTTAYPHGGSSGGGGNSGGGTTSYPYGGSGTGNNDDLSSFPFVGGSGGPHSSLAYMFPPPDLGRTCEVHMNMNAFPGGPAGAGYGLPIHKPGFWEMSWQICTYILCCGTKGLLSKFPSRAKRIDVLSRFIFPLIFAIFNLAYWLYYLFAKSKSPQLEEDESD